MNLAEILPEFAIVALLLVGISRIRSPRTARAGNHAAGLSVAAAIVVVLARHGVTEPATIAISLVAGALAGLVVAYRASMTAIPSLVAFQHGMGGVAVVLVSAIELSNGKLTAIGNVSGLVGLVLGAATFSASLVAAGKLANLLPQRPTSLPLHNLQLVVLVLFVVVFPIQQGFGDDRTAHIVAMLAGATVVGLLVSIRIGGADMPVLISFLNATAGLAAAFCGVTIENRLLIVIGATIASSGSILTIMMCRAMNRNLASIFFGGSPAGVSPPRVTAANVAVPPPVEVVPPVEVTRVDLLEQFAKLVLEARSVIVIPGYGMAVAHAQFEVVRLTKLLETLGKTVRFAIHPVAGRMPGHMNVLLAEADIDYDNLVEIEEANLVLPETDLALVVGACDVVNPAALQVSDTPLSGMPILNAHEARATVVCNLDERPGYSGVENPLYRSERTLLMLGDALQTMEELHARLIARSERPQVASHAATSDASVPHDHGEGSSTTPRGALERRGAG